MICFALPQVRDKSREAFAQMSREQQEHVHNRILTHCRETNNQMCSEVIVARWLRVGQTSFAATWKREPAKILENGQREHERWGVQTRCVFGLDRVEASHQAMMRNSSFQLASRLTMHGAEDVLEKRKVRRGDGIVSANNLSRPVEIMHELRAKDEIELQLARWVEVRGAWSLNSKY